MCLVNNGYQEARSHAHETATAYHVIFQMVNCSGILSVKVGGCISVHLIYPTWSAAVRCGCEI